MAKVSDDFQDDIFMRPSAWLDSRGVRMALKDELKKGLSHTEIALKFLNDENIKVRINPKLVTPDAVIAHFVSQKPELAKKHSRVLVAASKMNYTIDSSDHKSYALWALVSSHLYYPEIAGTQYLNTRSFDDNKELNLLHEQIEKLLKDEHGSHMETIAKFTDMIAEQTARIRQILDEERARVSEYSSQVEKSLKLLHNSGYRVLALKENEYIDPCALSIAANYASEKILIILKRDDKRLKVSLRAVKGKIGANLYKVLSEEERKVRNVKSLVDEWNGTSIAGGSPLDGTLISFDRLAMIISRHAKE
ncbi:MAG: hypothetical protein ACP5KJ_02345 [Candidatus Micrarchaeia archaeon]